MMEQKKETNLTEKEQDKLFTKAQLLESERFSGRKDILNALLKDGARYTIKAAEQSIERYMKGQVK